MVELRVATMMFLTNLMPSALAAIERDARVSFVSLTHVSNPKDRVPEYRFEPSVKIPVSVTWVADRILRLSLAHQGVY